MKTVRREDLKDGEPVCFVGIGIVGGERLQVDYGIPDWEFAFYDDDETDEMSGKGASE